MSSPSGDRVQVQRRYRDPPNADVCAAGDVYTISDADVVACNCLQRGRRSGSSMQASAEPPRPEEADHPLNVAALAVARDAFLESNRRSHHTLSVRTHPFDEFSGVIALFETAKKHLKFPKVALQLEDGAPRLPAPSA